MTQALRGRTMDAAKAKRRANLRKRLMEKA